MQDLKLIALDSEDLTVLSVHLQDAVIRVGDMTYQKADTRFAAVANRFDWTHAAKPDISDKDRLVRRRTGLRFERVLGVQVTGIDLSKKDTVLSLLTIAFEQGTAPSGHVTLAFSGGAAIRLDVECVEAELRDLGAAWATKGKPKHD